MSILKSCRTKKKWRMSLEFFLSKKLITSCRTSELIGKQNELEKIIILPSFEFWIKLSSLRIFRNLRSLFKVSFSLWSMFLGNLRVLLHAVIQGNDVTKISALGSADFKIWASSNLKETRLRIFGGFRRRRRKFRFDFKNLDLCLIKWSTRNVKLLQPIPSLKAQL